MRRALSLVVLLILVVLGAAAMALEILKNGVGKDRIASSLSSALGQPVEIGGLSVSLFPSPALDATQVRVGGVGPDAAPGVSVSALRIAPALTSLLPGRAFTIRRADLIGLVLSIRHTARGQWLAPVPPVGAGSPGSTRSPGRASPSAGVAIEALQIRNGGVRIIDEQLRRASGAATITTITGINAELHLIDGTLSVPAFDGRLGQTVVTGSADAGSKGITLHLSSTSIHNADLPALFALAGMAPLPELSISGTAPIDITTHVASDFATMTVVGQASFQQMALARITLQSLHAPFRLERNVFTVDPITFTIYGGHEQGRVSVNLSASPPTFALRTAIDQLDVNRALTATTTMKDFLLGTAHVAADVTGSGMSQAAIERSLAGSTQFAIQDGDIRNFPVLAAINRALGITTGSTSDTRFQSLSGSATIGGGQARTTDLALHAGDLTLLGAGTMAFDQTVNLHLTAQLSGAKSTEVAKVAAVAKRLEDPQGQIQLPITVTGTATAPKIGVDIQSIAKQQLPGLLQDAAKKQIGGQLGTQLQQLLKKP